MKICKVPEYGQSTYIHRWPLLVLTTFCFLLQQIRKWTTRMRIWLTCDFSTGQNHLKQDSYPNVWAPKLFLFPPRVPRLREGRQSAERKAALTRMNTVTTNKIGSAFPWILFLWFPLSPLSCIQNYLFSKDLCVCVCVCVCVSVCNPDVQQRK